MKLYFVLIILRNFDAIGISYVYWKIKTITDMRTYICLHVVTHDSGQKLVSFLSLLHYVAQNKTNGF